MNIGIVGMGGMGQMYAKAISNGGYQVSGCDFPARKAEIMRACPTLEWMEPPELARTSDMLIFSVPTENIGEVVKKYAPNVREGTIVAGQTSAKTPEIEAFEQHLPGANIVTCHSLYGPSVKDPSGHTTAVIRHRSSDEAYERAMDVFSKLGSQLVELPDYDTHDRMTADTQAATHLGFESMGTAWKTTGEFPWENPSYNGGIDNVKILMAMRIFGGKSHVYAGLALLNPHAKTQVAQYRASTKELSNLMINGDKRSLKERVYAARDAIFRNGNSPVMLDDSVMGDFRLGNGSNRKPNSHLSLLAMVDAWHNSGVNPYDNMVCQTPPFRLRLGITEYLFRNHELLDSSLDTAINGGHILKDDEAFVDAVDQWASIVERNDSEAYKKLFAETRSFFEQRIPEAMQKSSELIARLAQNR